MTFSRRSALQATIAAAALQADALSSHAGTMRTAGAAPWWSGAVLYEIYIRSFQDSNGDGIGDLKGPRC